MSGKAFYELEGIRPNGEKFTAEILGEIDLAEAADLARHYADLWGSSVRLYRVPYLNTSSTPWAADEMEFVNEFPAGKGGRKEPPSYYTQWLADLAAGKAHGNGD